MMQKPGMTVFFWIFVVSTLTFTNVELGFSSTENWSLEYRIKPKQIWNMDLSTEGLQKDDDHYVLKNDDSIDLLFSYSTSGLKAEFEKNGLEKVISQIESGNNLVHTLVSDTKVEIKNSKQTLLKNKKIIQVQFTSKYQIGKTLFSTVENYFLSDQQSLHVTLRYTDKSNLEQVKLAIADLNLIEVDLRNKK